MDRNRVEYQNLLHHSKAAPPLLPYYGVSVAQVFRSYDLLLATPPRTTAETKSPTPYIRFCALERSNSFRSPGSHASMLVRLKAVKLLHKGQKQTISGRKFIRTDVITERGQFIAMYETVAKDYLLLFEFHGGDEQEMNKFAQSIQLLAFDK